MGRNPAQKLRTRRNQITPIPSNPHFARLSTSPQPIIRNLLVNPNQIVMIEEISHFLSFFVALCLRVRFSSPYRFARYRAKNPGSFPFRSRNLCSAITRP